MQYKKILHDYLKAFALATIALVLAGLHQNFCAIVVATAAIVLAGRVLKDLL